MTRPADARLALSFGADFIGVIRYGKSPRFADDAAMAAVLAEVPSGHRVWVGVDPEPAELEDALRQGFDFLQIHFPVDVPEARIAGWAAVAGPARMWLAPRLEPGTTPSDAVARHCQTLLLDAHSPNAFGGTGRTGDWTAFERCRAELLEELTWIPLPKRVLAVGTIAARALMGDAFTDMDACNGMTWVDPHPERGWTVVPCYHPAGALRGGGEGILAKMCNAIREWRTDTILHPHYDLR